MPLKETAAPVRGEDHIVGRGRLGQSVHRRRRPVHLHAVEAADLLRHPRRGHRQGDPAGLALGGHQVEHDEQRPLVADHLTLLVHDPDPLADRVEPDAERCPGVRDQVS